MADVVRAVGRYLRMKPQQGRLVIDLIRGKPIEDAFAVLDFSRRKPARVIRKVLASAVANAENNAKLDRKKLVVRHATIDEGPALRTPAYRGAPRGRILRVRKRTSHVTIVVGEEGSKEQTE